MDQLSPIRDHADRLPSTDAWRRLPASSQRALDAICMPLRAHRGDSPTDDVVIVRSGAFGTLRETADGRRSLTCLALPGDFLDFRRRERQRQGRLLTLAEGVLLVPDVPALDALCQRDVAITTLLFDLMREAFTRARDHCTDIAIKTPLERLAAALLECRRRLHNPPLDQFALPLRRGDLAEYLGLKAETVSRGFRTLREEGFIAPESAGRISILNLPGLRQLANGGRPRRSTRPF
ncbi:MAG: helix-turn-helix domain-containing protein [Pseudomonadota bacterium]